MRLLAAALPPSTARNALVMAIEIFSPSNAVTLPLRLMTRNCPGAVAAILVESVAVMVGVVADCMDGCSWFGVFACIALPVMM